MTPINYRSPDGKYFIEVLPHQNFGMATIYDLDIMIWAAAQLNMQKNRGIQNPARTLHTRTYDLLRAIGRPAGGDHVKAVMAGM